MTAIRIVITANANPEMVRMIRNSYHRASGNKGFCDPEVIVQS